MSVSEVYKCFLDSKGVSIDTRTIKKGEIFFAIKGENFDGHQYVNTALEKGACHVVIENSDYQVAGKSILVENVLLALQETALRFRQDFNIPVLGITGSNGKTTTKELIYKVLSTQFNVSATKGNLNNHLGVPLTILSTPEDTEILIVEMGANHIGEIETLSNIALPKIGLITNIGQAHLEGFGSFEGVIKAKTELYQHIKENKGIIIFDSDNPILTQNLPSGSNNIPYSNDLEFIFNDLNLSFKKSDDDHVYSTHLYGAYNSVNIKAAVTIGRHFKIDDEKIFSAIANYEAKMNRSQILEIKGLTLIMDAYNANPSSMRSSLKSLMNVKTDKRKIAVLGDMKELGSDEELLHQEIFEYAQNQEIDELILIGKIFGKVNHKIEQQCFESVNDFLEKHTSLEDRWKDSIVLIKASRSLQLEKIAEAITTD